MDTAHEDGLVTTEGVDEGSSDSTAEDAGTGADADGRVPGAPGQQGAMPQEAASPPVDMESTQSRHARAESGTGQQLAEGEG